MPAETPPGDPQADQHRAPHGWAQCIGLAAVAVQQARRQQADGGRNEQYGEFGGDDQGADADGRRHAPAFAAAGGFRRKLTPWRVIARASRGALVGSGKGPSARKPWPSMSRCRRSEVSVVASVAACSKARNTGA
ncbi:hypothetical protein G6F31_020883 [Rhizopus arrhizus]|nr:hypothetical protein G6F31_020883 [Rhizopus arrhizus]